MDGEDQAANKSGDIESGTAKYGTRRWYQDCSQNKRCQEGNGKILREQGERGGSTHAHVRYSFRECSRILVLPASIVKLNLELGFNHLGRKPYPVSRLIFTHDEDSEVDAAYSIDL